MQKEIFVYVHVPKCFGTSFLDSIRSNDINENPKISENLAWFDMFHRYYARMYPSTSYDSPPNSDIEVTCFKDIILPLFLKSKKQKLLVHFHADTLNLDKIIPKEVRRTYILTIRNGADRLGSAYNYRLFQAQNDRGKNRPDWASSFFFENHGYYNGPERLVPRLFGYIDNCHIPYHHLEKIIILNLKDYTNKGHVTKYLEQQIGIDIEPCHANSKTICFSPPNKSDKTFWDRINKKIEIENKYWSYLLTYCYNNSFLNY